MCNDNNEVHCDSFCSNTFREDNKQDEIRDEDACFDAAIKRRSRYQSAKAKRESRMFCVDDSEWETRRQHWGTGETQNERPK